MMNRFLYNGKELQDDLDLRWYDYGARMYMPDLGRFGAMDPLTDLMVSWSPYHYTYNNPINFTDPSGMLPADRLGGWSKDFNQGFPEWGRQAIFDDRKPCICGSSNNGDGTNNGGGDDKIYEGEPLGEVTVSAPRRLDGVFGRVADSWMRKGLNYSTYGNIGFGWYETYGLESFPDFPGPSMIGVQVQGDLGSLAYVNPADVSTELMYVGRNTAKFVWNRTANSGVAGGDTPSASASFLLGFSPALNPNPSALKGFSQYHTFSYGFISVSYIRDYDPVTKELGSNWNIFSIGTQTSGWGYKVGVSKSW